MANSTTNVDTVIASQASKEVTINAALDAASQAMTYGRRASTSSGLTWGHYGGNVVKTDGTMAQIANGTLTLTASNTNYIVAAKATGAVSVSTATTNWLNQADYWRLYSVVTGAATVTSYTDSRDFMQRPANVGGMATVALGGTGQDFSAVEKGGIISGTDSGEFGLTAVGTDGYFLAADAASAGGIKWVAVPGGGDMLLGTAQTVTASKSFDDGTLIIKGATSGTTTIKAAAEAGTTTATFPAASGTVALTSNKLSAFAETSSAELAGVISDETGSGALVFATSPTLVTPSLGTPASGTLTNCTGLPIAGGGTGQTTAQDAINALTAASAATNEYVLTKDTATGNAIFKAAAGGAPSTMDFRLTLTTAVPVTTADVTGANTIYCTPYKGNQIGLFDGTNWNIRTSAQFSLELVGLTSGKPYDVFCYDDAGTPKLEFLVWTNDTTRATALAYQDGILVKSGATTRRYLGTFYTTGTTTTELSAQFCYLRNFYNRVPRDLRRIETTASWTSTDVNFHLANTSATNKVHFVNCSADDYLIVGMLGVYQNNTVQTGGAVMSIGLDSESAESANTSRVLMSTTAANSYLPLTATYSGYPGVGKHYLSWLELTPEVGTSTFYGVSRLGLIGRIEA